MTDTNELWAAAERLRLYYTTDYDYGDRPKGFHADVERLLSEHPADDGEPVTPEWLRTAGFADRCGEVFALKGGGVWVHVWGRLDRSREECWFIALDNHAPLREGAITRSDVRRLLTALNITEPAP